MKDQDKSPCHIGFVFVELGRSFLVFFFPEVDVDLADLDNFTGVGRIRFVPRYSGNVDDHGGHSTDRFRYLIAVVQLNMISDVLEGAMEHGRVVGARVIKNVILQARCFAHILG